MTELWRYRCPRGHASWKTSGDGYTCDRCRANGVDHHFDELVDVKTESL